MNKTDDILDNPNLSPTAKRVLEDFSTKLHSDGDIDDAAIERMRALLYGSKPPKPEDFAKALFDPPDGDEI